MLPVSIIILTYNEEKNLGGCLESLRGISDDIHIVDSFSKDGTKEIATSYGVSWYEHPFENYARQRNWAIQNVTFKYQWQLHLDAGERVSAEFIEYIKSFNFNGTQDGVMFSRRIIFLDRHLKYGGIYPNFHLRLFRSGKGRVEDKVYDQHFVVEGTVSRAPVGADIIDTLSENFKDFTERHLKWAIKEASEILAQTGNQGEVKARFFGNPMERRRWWKNKLFQRSPKFTRGFAFFIYRYIFRLGFLDGKPGLIYHVLQGFWFRFLIDAIVYDVEIAKEGEQKLTTDYIK